ncbi:alginate-c5-mannuronan-epimerase AlgG [Rhodobacterales bacterium HTCC2150]|nr:alginate-c5-mannuronan-epimerase AlgG [Rhodobacterales bacterium HTCC2150] [Rhodobacteraceae bacterium HTCC2150]
MFLCLIKRFLLIAGLSFTPTLGVACIWSDAASEGDAGINITSGDCSFDQLAKSRYITLSDRIATLAATIRVSRGASLLIDDTIIKELRLLSTPETQAHIIAEAGTLRILDVTILSYDPATGGPDLDMSDGRAFLRVDSFVDKTGQAANGRLEMERSTISYLGYDSQVVESVFFSTYGISLKVTSESDLTNAFVTGYIRDSTLSYNFRGFYSYGAKNFEIRGSKIHDNTDYGVDGHDDTDQFIVTENIIYSNGGTGLMCSRRCSDNVFSSNIIYGNGANGIMLHDLSLGGQIINNTSYDNKLDGIVVHDTYGTLVANNEIYGNRYGLRIFAGSSLTRVEANRFGANETDIFLKHGNLEAFDDLSDYNEGTEWNGQNISRHTDSRIWGVEVVGNTFDKPATISVRGAKFLNFTENLYPEGVVFDIRSSDRVILDGAKAKGPVIYTLRSTKDAPATYKIAPSLGASLSMTENDRVALLGDQNMASIEVNDFQLYIDNIEPPVLTLALGARPKIRSGTLIDLPLEVVSGTGAILNFENISTLKRVFAFTLIGATWKGVSLRDSLRECMVVGWAFDTNSSNKIVRYTFSGDAVWVPEELGDEIPVTLTCLAENSN